ncbi:6643_t:CDS:1 [Ambispora leptoticha]|uniref:6643_t:CDS:1 n=1 Tax=Ambispora leptoticha TaxID=144679 RepID=A0A9N8ZHC1_9GLOM|nr:6643_t:CDS:1 [Ambispora leptoticha]
MSEYTEIFAPLVALFNRTQVTAILMAWLPKQLEQYLSGVMAVDMFVTCTIATGITTLLSALYHFTYKDWTDTSTSKGKVVTLQIEPTTTGRWGYQYPSQFYEALSWMISQQTRHLKEGAFILQKPSDEDRKNDANKDDCAPQEFNILPEKDQTVIIQYKGKEFNVTFKCLESDDPDNPDEDSRHKKSKPSIFLTTKQETETEVDSVADFINGVTRAHLEYLRSKKVRSRYERNGNKWNLIQALTGNRDLDTVALDKPQEILIKKELETFTNDKNFYTRLGLPYRRGILLYGKPGTGKTSLINAISAHLQRDLYFINLKNLKKENPDSELSAAFSSVPANQIIVLEDVDTQSKVLHKRSLQKQDFFEAMVGDGCPVVSSGFGPDFSLSTFLGCLDGHTISEGIIIIMTTNHIEHLDPAVIRPGRMDVQLNLGYSTHYQIKKMFASVTENTELEFPQKILDQIPEDLLPPCQVMTTMVLYRKEPELIPGKILALVDKAKKNEEKQECIQQVEKNEFLKEIKAEVKSEADGKTNEERENEEENDSSKEEKNNFKVNLINFEESNSTIIIDKIPNNDAISSGSCTDVEEESKSTNLLQGTESKIIENTSSAWETVSGVK